MQVPMEILEIQYLDLKDHEKSMKRLCGVKQVYTEFLNSEA